MEQLLIKEAQDRCQVHGIESLSDRELLHLIIGSGTKNQSSEELINKILILKSEYGLKRMTKEFLISNVKGLTPRKAEILLATIEFGKRMYSEVPAAGWVIQSPQDGAEFLMDMRHLSQVHFVVVFLNNKKVVIGRKTIFIGGFNNSLVYPREIFHEALKRCAASILVAHNNPSMSTVPSAEDIEVAKRLVKVSEIVGIELTDHLIIGNGYTSMKEKGYI